MTARTTDYAHLQDSFSRHVIKSETHSDDLSSWLMKRPHEDGGFTSVFWCRVTVSEGRLTVIGDFDPVVFAACPSSVCPEAVVGWMGARPELCSYVMEKASIGTGGSAVRELCDEKAIADLREQAACERSHAAECEEARLAELAQLSAEERGNMDICEEDCARDSSEDYHLKRAAAFEAGTQACVPGYSTHPWSAASVIARIEHVTEEGGDAIEPCDDFRRVGEKPATRVVLGHLAVRHLHKLLTERGERWRPGDVLVGAGEGAQDERMIKVLHVLDESTVCAELVAVNDRDGWRERWPGEVRCELWSVGGEGTIQSCAYWVGVDGQQRHARKWRRARPEDLEGAKSKRPYVKCEAGVPF